MKYLCDTQIFLWWLNGDKRLKSSIKNIIRNSANFFLVSVVNGWEISIKLQNNPEFKLKSSIETSFQKSNMEILDVKLSHVLEFHKLPVIHKDPFDRMLVAQAKVEGAILISADSKIWKYNVPVLKA